MKYIILLFFISSCTTYPTIKYEAIDNKGKTLTIHEYKGTYKEPQHNIGDTVVIHATYGIFGLISQLEYDPDRLSYEYKNVIITELK